VRGLGVLIVAACGRVGFGEAPLVTVGATTSDSCGACSALTTPLVIPPSELDRVLLVGVAIGTNSPVRPAGTATAVALGGLDLALVRRTMLADVTADEEVWSLVAPPIGRNDLTVTLTAATESLFVGAITLTGASQAAPIRDSAGSAGSSSQDAIGLVASAPLDVVVDFVCGGASIDAPGSSQTQVLVDRGGNITTCGNLAASTSAGAPTVTLEWSVNGAVSDNWIDIATSIEPAGD
jgi:hypothetical protein